MEDTKQKIDTASSDNFCVTTNSNSVERATADVVRTALEGVSGEVFAVGFSEKELPELIEVLRSMDSGPTVCLLCRGSVLRWLRRDFILASAVADLIDAGRISMRSSDERFENMLLVTGGTVVSIVPAAECIGELVSADGEFVESVRERWKDVWESAEEFHLRTPARSRVEESLEEKFGMAVKSDVLTVLDSVGDTRRNKSGLDEVRILLLVAAKHEQLLYDLSTWGEDLRVGSRATFSQLKSQLEEKGLIETEKVPVDVGRPRLRLLLSDERLHEAESDELARVAEELLSPSST